MSMDEDMERTLRKEQVLGTHAAKGQHHQAHKTAQDFVTRSINMIGKDRGFHHSDAVKAAEELRMEDGKHSHDPIYHDSKKNK